MKKDAILSEDRKYRYVLSRIWDESKPLVVIIGLNPSTADEKDDDNTIKKCINFSKNWGYGGLYMLNLFAFRATAPSDMFNASSPIGEENSKYIEKYSKLSDKVICAWGNNGNFKNRSKEVLLNIENKFYLKLNKTGEPAHPLYLNKNLIPIKF
ncbi:DUF1643 domain-containing protein [Aliarcobacter cryaerophilus]|jgi:hypothetical protein|uniref:DUF1643 domain-containing protein n=2 Tax=unclassified Arcobacter TaxID=2593671 RepID=A0AA96D9C2_9BACT|nr:DUF1643 domain-containing protein [Arcobacter sp. AZ-2023]WPD09790.1 DUF1643 domain-containing protein [Arcobacter sp. DSM 115954]WNL14620.1 DUF1643 domain-containing protein [Arcobacter sp. AZ-2023]WNL19497.1 DUF1643 domain-containing protein [Arcobacter sp. AZ-2023]WNL21636.1 DUF1643 domain-containing protein [Arcobacter sp. AZ-2023]